MAMGKHDKLDIAMQEVDRFLHFARIAMQEHKAESKNNVNWYYSSTKLAAAKRASLDLTRALSAFRKP